MNVRRATRDDLERIVELFRQLSLDSAREIDANDPAYARAFDEIANDARQMIVVVELDGRVVGTATLSFLPNLSHGGRPVAQLESVVVDEGVRGRGAGEALIRWCLERARERGCFRAQLTSDLRRADAHRFWTKLGFTHTHAGFKQPL